MDNLSQFTALCRERFSCRSFSSRPVSRELLDAVMQTVRLAPSACNRQPWTFILVDDPECLGQLRPAYRKEGFKDAPVMAVCLGHHDEAWIRPTDGKDHTDIDLAIAIEHLCLGAAAAGLASCWVCSFDVDLVKERLALPDNLEPVAIIPLGYAADGVASPEKTRKPLCDIVRWQKL